MIVPDALELCVDCWSSVKFLTATGCSICHTPEVDDGLVCAPCLQRRPAHDGAKAATVYQGAAKDIVLKLKHGRRIGLAPLMAKAMVRHIHSDTLMLLPVPLHRWRLWRRGFNQSLLLARALSTLSAKAVRHDILFRAKATPALGGLGAKAREKAMVGVFKIHAVHRPLLRGAHVTLVDDVYTSGATANACAVALKRAGALRVDVLSWARVLKEADPGN